MECEFCGKEFSTKANLIRHQKTVTSCISTQGKNLIEYVCEYCNKTYTVKSSLNRHLSSCKIKRNLEIEQNISDIKTRYDKKISKLKKSHEKEQTDLLETIKDLKAKNKKLIKTIEEKDEEIKSLRSKSDKADGKVEVYDKVCDKVLNKSTITNNTMNIHPKLANLPITTIHPLTEDYVKERVSNGEYTFDHYRRGEDGVVDFINSIIMCENDNGEMERNYVTTDTSRDSFHRLVETKEWQKDKGGKFIDVILDNLGDRVHDYQMKLMDEREKYKNSHCPNGYDPDAIYRRNNELHTGIVQPRGRERHSLRKRIKKETSNKVSV